MKKNTRWHLLLGVGGLLIGATLVTVGNVASARTQLEATVPADARYDVAALYDRPDAEDRLPALVNGNELGVEGLQADTVRKLATTPLSEIYLALDDTGLLCLVMYLPDELGEWTSGSTCTTPEGLSSYGLGLRVGGASDTAEAYLLPDAAVAKVDMVATRDFDQPHPNVMTIDADTPAAEREQFAKAAAESKIPIFLEPVSYVAE